MDQEKSAQQDFSLALLVVSCVHKTLYRDSRTWSKLLFPFSNQLLGLHVAFALMAALILIFGDSLTATTVSRIETLMHWSIYMTCLCTFHFLEFFVTAISQPSLLSYECEWNLLILSIITLISRHWTHTYWPLIFLLIIPAFIVNHSKAYTIALLASWAEFWLEYILFPSFKLYYVTAGTGLMLMIAGQVSSTLILTVLIVSSLPLYYSVVPSFHISSK